MKKGLRECAQFTNWCGLRACERVLQDDCLEVSCLEALPWLGSGVGSGQSISDPEACLLLLKKKLRYPGSVVHYYAAHSLGGVWAGSGGGWSESSVIHIAYWSSTVGKKTPADSKPARTRRAARWAAADQFLSPAIMQGLLGSWMSSLLSHWNRPVLR